MSVVDFLVFEVLLIQFLLILYWLYDDFQVYDATNSTRQRRQLIVEFLVDYRTFFVESNCSDPEVIEANIRVCFNYTESLKCTNCHLCF